MPSEKRSIKNVLTFKNLKYLITIIGPTGIGKTALSIKLANLYNCSIISCDSRQFFKEMTIGTAVPSAEELQVAEHYFIQNKSILDSYNVGDFEREAIETLDKLFKKKSVQILVGGSGLYVDALLYGLDNFPEASNEIRETLQEEYSKKGIQFLQEKLQTLDPGYYLHLENTNAQTLKNPQRLMRFVEVCLASGKPYSAFINQPKRKRNFTPIIIGLEAEREIMYDRINQRVNTMLRDGLEDEAKKLLPCKNLNALQTVGYRELFNYFEGQTSREFAIEEIKKNTRRFAKRQITWFKRSDKAKWFSWNYDIKEINEYIDKTIEDEKV
jgi:tRNA dimethylallyltransferase